MVEPLRHRQTKGAETDMPGLPPPRHFPTLPEVDQRVGRAALDFEHEADFGLRVQRRGYTQLDRPLDER
jgi:hypothetical protein